MTMSYEHGLRMARWMKNDAEKIERAIHKVEDANYGVVALRFTDEGRHMTIEILDEPYAGDVRVYPGD